MSLVSGCFNGFVQSSMCGLPELPDHMLPLFGQLEDEIDDVTGTGIQDHSHEKGGHLGLMKFWGVQMCRGGIYEGQ